MSNSALITGSILIAIVAGVGVFAWYATDGFSSSEPSAAERSLLGEEGATPFTDMAGDEVTLDTFLGSGQYIIVTSWASWCPQCGDQLADLNSFAATHEAAVSVVAVNRSERSNQAERYLNSLPDTDMLHVILDPDDRFYRDIGGYTVPETVVYDQAGEVVEHYHGVVSAAALEELASDLDL